MPVDPSPEGSDPAPTRRRFLKATGAATLTAALAGCGGSGQGGDPATGDGTTMEDPNPTTSRTSTPTESPTETATTTTPPPARFREYPYGIGESRVETARQVMEKAGYNADNKFELVWKTYGGIPDFKKQLQSELRDAHIELTISPTILRLDALDQGEYDAYSLGWIQNYPVGSNFLRLVDPPNTNHRREDADGGYFFWTSESDHGEGRTVAMEQFDRIQKPTPPTEDGRTIPADAVRRIEEAVWNDVPLLTFRHGVEEIVWHDSVEWDIPGALGIGFYKYHRLTVQGDEPPVFVEEPIGTLDPIAISARSDSSVSVATNLFDPLLGYHNATVQVEPLLIEGYETSDDLTTYTFQLKEDVTFHDGQELTAQDVVYSFRRLLESDNSANSRFPESVLGLTYETETVTNEQGKELQEPVPDTLGVTAVDDYTVEIELEEPFGQALSVLAHSAFSIVPEGIVGDIEGYDGEMTYEAFRTDPVGCGPFEMGKWEDRKSLTVERFENYHGSTAQEARIRWVIGDPGDGYERFADGEADVATFDRFYDDDIDQSMIATTGTDERGRQLGTYGPFENGMTANYARIPQLSTLYMGFNCERTPMPVRRAVAYVLDREWLLDDIQHSRPLPAYHVTPPNLFPGGPEGYDRHFRGDEND